MKMHCLKMGFCLVAATASLLQASAAEGRDSRGLSRLSPELAFYVHRRTKELLPGPWRPRSAKIAVAVLETAATLKVDPLFLMSMIVNESQFNPEAIGGHGEIGLIQMKPSTAKWLLERGDVLSFIHQHPIDANSLESIAQALMDPATNLAFGAAYLAHLKKVFPGRGTMFLTAYNMGAVNLKTHLRDGKRPHQYSDRVTRIYASLSRHFDLEQAKARRSIASLSSTFNRPW